MRSWLHGGWSKISILSRSSFLLSHPRSSALSCCRRVIRLLINISFFFTETSVQLFTVEVRINGSNIWHYFAVDVLLKIPLNINYKHFSECSLIFFHRFFESSAIHIFFSDILGFVSKHIFDCMPLYVWKTVHKMYFPKYFL